MKIKMSTFVLFLLLPSLLQAGAPAAQSDPGIFVEMPKPFDVRDLEAILRLRQRELAMVSAINGAPLNAAIGNVQGRTADSTAFGLRASEVADPAAADAATGIPTLAGQTPFAPTLPVGVNARDLLSEQVSLGHEITNLQLLLNRALSDRVSVALLSSGDPRQGATFLEVPREMVLLGFHIDLLPNKRHANQVAEVQIRVRPADTPCTDDSMPCTLRDEAQPLSLAMVFPEKNTYNVASFTNDTKSVGLGAIAGVVSLGLAASKSRETFYLVRDTDVVAFRGRSDESSQVFGWQFRPVLGRRTVEPGPRQVYALLSVANLGARRRHELEIEIETCWRALKRRSQTLGEQRSCSRSEPATLYVPGARLVDNVLLARSLKVNWDEIGGGKMLVSVEGIDFDSDTAVTVGGRKLGDTDSLRISGRSRMSFVVPAKALLGDSFQLAGRYGNPLALENPTSLSPLTIRKADLKVTRSSPTVTLVLEGIQGLRPKEVEGLRSSHPILEVGGEVFTDLRRLDDATIEVTLPVSQLFKDHEITLIEPFVTGGIHRGSTAIPLGDLFQAEAPVAVATLEKKTRLTIAGRNFHGDKVSVTIGDTRLAADQLQVGSDRIVFDVETVLLGTASQIIVAQGDAPAIHLPVKPAAKEPDLSISGEIRQGESITVRLQGRLAPSVESVRFEDRDLPITKRDAQGVQVRLTEAVTSRAGRRQITAVLKRGPDDTTNPLQEVDLTILPPRTLTLSNGH